jgi:hypothetical protein
MKHYTLSAVEDLINRYVERGGEVAIEIVEGSLGYGTTICFGDGLKTAVIQEHFETAWSSIHTITMYKKMPKKYQLMLDHENRI